MVPIKPQFKEAEGGGYFKEIIEINIEWKIDNGTWVRYETEKYCWKYRLYRDRDVEMES